MPKRGNPEETVNLATSLEGLLKNLGRPHILTEVSQIREEEAEKIGTWSHASFVAARSRIERMLESGNLQEAFTEATALRDKCLAAGDGAYSGADYDTAIAFFMLGRVLNRGGASHEALEPLHEAQTRFQTLADRGSRMAAVMVSATLTEMGDCLFDLGRLDEAAAAYEEGIKISEKLEDTRTVAVGKGQLGTVRLYQKRYEDALKAHESARKIFEELGEPGSVAIAWHQTGMVYQKSGLYEKAEKAYQKSLALIVQQNNKAGEASSLGQLGLLYKKMGHLEDAVVFFRQAADIHIKLGDKLGEGRTHNNLALVLIQLKRFDEARAELMAAIECKKPYGHAATPWTTWAILSDLENAVGNHEAAQEARNKAVGLYLSYRRDGGENHERSGRVCAMFTQAVSEGKIEEMKTGLVQLVNDSETPAELKALADALLQILSGSRDPQLAENPELYYRDAAEVMLILERMT